MGKTRGVRLSDEVNAWVDEYAVSRGVEPSALMRTAIESFKEDCEAGVPEIRQRPKPPLGVGQCPKREEGEGHVFVSPRVDQDRPCRFCGLKGRLTRPIGVVTKEVPNHLDQATAARSAFFSTLKVPMQNGTGDPKKAYPEGMPPAAAAQAKAIREDKSRRDQEPKS